MSLSGRLCLEGSEGRMSQIKVINLLVPSEEIGTVELVQLPDGFDAEECTKIGMYSIALAFGIPPHWLLKRGQSTEKEAKVTAT